MAVVHVLRACQALEECEFPNECLEAWAASETATLLCGWGSSRLQGDLRKHVVEFLLSVCSKFQMPPERLAASVTLLDVFLARQKLARIAAMLPSTCVAIVALLCKADVRGKPGGLQVLASRFSQHLCALEHLNGTEDLVHITELDVLQVLQWRIDIPTIETQLWALYHRLDVVTNHHFKKSLEWSCQRQIVQARVLLMQTSALDLQPASFLARGLWCLGLVAAGWFPFDLFCPPGPLQQTSRGPEVRCWLDLLAMVTCVPAEELQNNALSCARCLQVANTGSVD